MKFFTRRIKLPLFLLFGHFVLQAILLVYVKIYLSQEELNHVSENQIAEMQRRHGQSSITNQFRNMFGNGARNNPPGGDYTYADGVRPEATALATEQVPPPLPARDHQQQQQHSPRQVNPVNTWGDRSDKASQMKVIN